SPHAIHVVGSPTLVELHVCAVRPSDFSEFFPECPNADAHFGIALRIRHQNPDAPHPVALLRPRRARPRSRSAAKQRDERAALHSITSSASESRLSEILTPSAFAVLRLITNSNFVGCNTGRSAGFSPFKIRAV